MLKWAVRALFAVLNVMCERAASTFLVFPTLCPIALPGLRLNFSILKQEQPACQHREP